jgi:hypothetical protein
MLRRDNEDPSCRKSNTATELPSLETQKRENAEPRRNTLLKESEDPK